MIILWFLKKVHKHFNIDYKKNPLENHNQKIRNEEAYVSITFPYHMMLNCTQTVRPYTNTMEKLAGSKEKEFYLSCQVMIYFPNFIRWIRYPWPVEELC